jgi:hypothetical protein
VRNRRHFNADGTEKRRMTHAEAIGTVRRFPESERMTAYPCGSHWHVGHTPPQQANYGAMVRRPVSQVDPWATPRLGSIDVLRRVFISWLLQAQV